MTTRRSFLKKALYLAPVILTVAVRPSHASGPYAPGNNSGPPAGDGGGGGTSTAAPYRYRQWAVRRFR